MGSRPLSPHLQIYHPAMTMMMSVAHRLTGLGLYVLMLGFVAWLALLAFDPALFNQVQIWASHLIGQTILFFACWLFMHHLFGGLRHFLWDTGRGLGVRGREWLAWGTLIFGLLAACGIIWGPVYQQIIGGDWL